MNNTDLAKRMESGDFPNAEFHHEQHLQLAWHYLRTYERRAAIERMRATIRNFAGGLGHPEKYHDTATIAWMRLVEAALRCSPQIGDFAAFLTAHAWLRGRDALLAFYSQERLDSPQARAQWVDPDLRPLPAAS